MAGRYRAALSALLMLGVVSGKAEAAQIAVDLQAGSVLIAHEADAVRRPASLVKLMTGYLAFRALEAGELSEDTPVKISANAARQPPVKLGLRKGQEVAFGDLLRAALVGSKNDAAVAVAEAVAGDEARFAERMNEAAATLGMRNTRYANATGLPKSGQQTTARDIALLASALLRDFPERSEIFGERSVRAQGRSVSTTNPLFGRVAGARGMKTGFTCAAGYSIAGLVEADGRRVLAVTLGHPSKGERLAAVKGLIAAALDVPGGGETLEPGATQTDTPPDIRACSGRGAEIVATDIPVPVDADLYLAGVAAPPRPLPPPPREEVTREAVRPPVAAVRVQPSRPAALAPPRPTAPPRPAAPPKPPPPPPIQGWGVFIGAFDGAEGAKRALEALRRQEAAAALYPGTERRTRDGKALAFLYGATQGQAAASCAAAKRLGLYCVVLNPDRLRNSGARWRR